MKKNHIFAFAGIIIVVAFFAIAALAIAVPKERTTAYEITKSSGDISRTSGNLVEVKMKMRNGVYLFDPLSVNAGDAVRITADMGTISGSYTTVVIPDLNVRKSLTKSDNIIEFTASKAGTFRVTCGMGMATGKLVVK